MTPRRVTDDAGRALEVPVSPRRIVSLCPSQTETLFELGLDDRIVGTTRYCIHPRGRVERTLRVGGTKRVDVARVRSLEPDLILAEKEENPREMVDALSALAPVFVTDVVDVPSALAMIRTLGMLTERTPAADAMVGAIETDWASMPQPASRPRVAYLIWRNPWMAAGPGTYLDAALHAAGFDNVFSAAESMHGRYPSFELKDLATLQPEVVLLSSEPFPFGARHTAEILAAMPTARVLTTDGEAWSWYGARMRALPPLVAELHRALGL